MLDYSKKPIIAMLHLMGWGSRDILERMIREANIYYENGVDAVVTTGSGTGEDAPRRSSWSSERSWGRSR